MLPIVDTPVIQYVVEEAVAAGITDILMIIGKGKRAIEEHFDRSFQLEAQLQEKGRDKELQVIKRISDLADIHFVWQKEMKGLGDAIYCARHHVGNEPFAVLLGDTIMDAPSPAIGQLCQVYSEYQKSAVLLEQVAPERVSKYGVIDGAAVEERLFKVNNFVEKPAVEEAPSNMVIASRYIFTPEIFSYLEKTTPGVGGEIQITDAMKLMVAEHDMYGRILDGRRCDIGNKQGFVKTNIEFALKHLDIADEMAYFIKDLASKL